MNEIDINTKPYNNIVLFKFILYCSCIIIEIKSLLLSPFFSLNLDKYL